MDRAVKSALDKYLGKNSGGRKGEPKNFSQTLINVLLVALIISTLLFCGIHFDVLGLGKAWSQVKNITVGEKTVGQVLDDIKEATDHFFEIEYQTSQPLNPDGESGSVSETDVEADQMLYR